MSGNGRNGTLHNGVKWISPGYQGGGVNFDGVTDTRIELGTWNPAEGTGKLSVAMWIRWSGGNNTYQGLLGKRNTWPDTTMFQFQVRPENGGTFRLETGSVAIVSPNNTLSPLVQVWVHVAATFDGTTARLYLNGEQVASGAFSFYAAGVASNMGIGCVTGGGAGFSGNGEVFQGDIDEVGIYNRALSKEEISLVMKGYGGDKATNPQPADRAIDVPLDAVLSWDPLATAGTRDVYFGTTYADVNDASRAKPGDVVASLTQAATTFEPAGLEYGQPYYWRVDEVNATPDGTIFKGDVWSFTAEPYAYPITKVTARASGSLPGMGPEKTIDGLGLNANDEHSVELTQMWVALATQGAWIRYEFDKVYRLHELWVWNSNSVLETTGMGFGARQVKIEYSLDGDVWTLLEGVSEFAKAPGSPAYTHNTTVSFGGVAAKYVRLTIESTWAATMTQASLSEVRFFYVPVQAREPEPTDGATNVGVATDLTWRPGRDAQSHDIYFGTDADAVATGTVPAATQTERSYTPVPLEFGTAYYWKVDEVGQAETYEGNLWSFTTQEYALVEDFESYTNDSPNRVFQTWIDGYGFSPDEFFPNGGAGNGSGAIVGYDPGVADIMEHAIVHGGAQSMPLLYDNSASPFYSEAQRTFTTAQDWTAHGADTLALYVRGNAGDFTETTDGQIIMSAIGVDIWDTADQFRYAYKNLSGDGSITVRVESLGRSDGWAKAGVMIRESVHPGSKHAFMCMTPDYGPSFQQRPQTGNVMSQVSVVGLTTPRWVKLTRAGNVFTAQHSADGVTWTNIAFTAPVNITMASDVLVGLAVTSHNASVSTAAEFSNLSMSGKVTGQWQTAEIGAEQPKGNSVESMYVTIKDSSGGSATVTNADEVITLRPTWQQWKIPYSDLAGVKLTQVKAMCIGVGNRQAPTTGGTGTVYVDDIAVGRPAQ
jgi:regulation of enolase protein 1 (concanavalin A-like superfamily)